MDSKKGGLLVGATDKNGGKGIQVLASEGNIRMGGGEIIINEQAATENCEELSKINKSTGGVAIPCDIKGNTGNQKTMLFGGRIGMGEYSQINDTLYHWIIGNLMVYSLYKKGETTTLSSIITHPELFELLPDIKDVRISFKNANENSGRVENLEKIFISKKLSDIEIFITLNFSYYESEQIEYRTLDSAEPDLAKESILLHELQHVLQAVYNRSSGTTNTTGSIQANATISSLENKAISGRGLTKEESELYEYYKFINQRGLLELYFYYSDDSEMEARRVVRRWLKSKGVAYIDPLKEYFGIEVMNNGGVIEKYEKNDLGGYNYKGDAAHRAHAANLFTLPLSAHGNSCHNCKFQKNHFCVHPEVLLPVTPRMICKFWDKKNTTMNTGGKTKNESYYIKNDSGYFSTNFGNSKPFSFTEKKEEALKYDHHEAEDLMQWLADMGYTDLQMVSCDCAHSMSDGGKINEEGSRKGTGMLYEFFTPEIPAEKMWQLANKYGFKQDGKVLEPAVGNGRLVVGAPVKSNVTAFEINPDNIDMLKQKYPEVKVYPQSFETAFLEYPRLNSKIKSKTIPTWLTDYPFDLVIANPPYGKFTGFYASFFNYKTQFEHWFIEYTLKLLKPGGLGIYLIPSSFLRNGISYNTVKERIFEQAKLLEAYRLPANIFAKTQIGTDIIVLQKK